MAINWQNKQAIQYSELAAYGRLFNAWKESLTIRITTAMLQELEQSIAPDAKAEIRIYAGGCDIRVRWDKGLKEVNQNLGALVQPHSVEIVAIIRITAEQFLDWTCLPGELIGLIKL